MHSLRANKRRFRRAQMADRLLDPFFDSPNVSVIWTNGSVSDGLPNLFPSNTLQLQMAVNFIN